MVFLLKIECDNSAFEPEPGDEVARILREAADKIERGSTGVRLRDVNGNKVGKCRLLGDPPPSPEVQELRRKHAEFAAFLDSLLND
jgi:hypothetical protein